MELILCVFLFIHFLFSLTLVFGICSYFLHQNSTQDKSIAQLSVCTRLCTIACLLCKLPAFPSFGIRLGDTNLTCTQKKKNKTQKSFIEAFRRTVGMQSSKWALNLKKNVRRRAWRGGLARAGPGKGRRAE